MDENGLIGLEAFGDLLLKAQTIYDNNNLGDGVGMEHGLKEFVITNAKGIDTFLSVYRLWMDRIVNLTIALQNMLREAIPCEDILIKTYKGEGMLFACAYVEGLSKSKPGVSTLVVEPYIDSSSRWGISVFERDPNKLTDTFLSYLRGKGLTVTEDRMEGFERTLLSDIFGLDDLGAVRDKAVELYTLLF